LAWFLIRVILATKSNIQQIDPNLTGLFSSQTVSFEISFGSCKKLFWSLLTW